jgi:hypothetical protein
LSRKKSLNSRGKSLEDLSDQRQTFKSFQLKYRFEINLPSVLERSSAPNLNLLRINTPQSISLTNIIANRFKPVNNRGRFFTELRAVFPSAPSAMTAHKKKGIALPSFMLSSFRSFNNNSQNVGWREKVRGKARGMSRDGCK